MPPINETQALVPRGSSVIENPIGSAPGLHFTHLDTECFALPGVPSEAEEMLRAYVIPFLKSRNPGLCSGLRMVRTIGIGESALAERLSGFDLEEPELSLGTIARASGVDLHLSASSVDAMWLQGILDRGERKLLERAGDYAYALGDRTLSEVVGGALLTRGLPIATANPFTGGRRPRRDAGQLRLLTPGKDRALERFKEKPSGSRPTLWRFGAVSRDRARGRGARERLGTSAPCPRRGSRVRGKRREAGRALLLAIRAPRARRAERRFHVGARTSSRAASFFALDLACRRSLGAGVAWSEPSSRS
jgi:nicotinamide-nucleotide amidase